MKNELKFKLKIIVAAMLFSPSVVFATNGYFAHGWGMKSKSMGGAGIASPQDGLAAANNPAGMVMIGNRLDFGIDVFSPNREATISGNGNPANDQVADGNGDDNFLIPEFGYNQMINNDMSFGVSVYGNGGMNTNYKNGINLFNGGTGEETGVNLSQLFVAPTFSMKINKDHAFGVSVNLAYQIFEAKGIGAICNAASSNPGNCSNNGEDSSTGFGFSVGYLGKISPSFAVGVSYRSETKMSKFDKYAGLFAEQGDFDIPSMYGVGLEWTPSSEWTVMLDYSRINYSDIAAIANSVNNLGTGGALGLDNGAGFGWQDMDFYKVGIAWQMSKSVTLRGGLSYGKQPIPENETLFNVLAPATVETHLTLGATWILSSGSELTLAYMHAFENTVSGSGSIPVGFGGGEADIKMSQNSLGLAYGWKF